MNWYKSIKLSQQQTPFAQLSGMDKMLHILDNADDISKHEPEIMHLAALLDDEYVMTDEAEEKLMNALNPYGAINVEQLKRVLLEIKVSNSASMIGQAASSKTIKVSERELVPLEGVDKKIEQDNLEWWRKEVLRFELELERAKRTVQGEQNTDAISRLNKEIENCHSVIARIEKRLEDGAFWSDDPDLEGLTVKDYRRK